MQQKQHLDTILKDTNELTCLLTIREKLTPLTANYLVHLAQQVKKSVKKDLVITSDISKLTTDINEINNWTQDAGSKALKQKIDAVVGLYKTLTDESKLKPSKQISQFYHQLDQAHAVIKTHRDPAWKRFVANAVATAGIILTGILPGLAVLAVVAAFSGKSPKYWQSQGETFFRTIKDEIKEVVPEAKNKL